MKSTIIFFALCLCSFNCFGQCREAEYDPSERPFSGTVCWGCPGDGNHIIRAQEMADWLKEKPFVGCPTATELTGETFRSALQGKKGIIFFKDYWQRAGESGDARTGDHIDLWDGRGLDRLRGLGTIANFLTNTLEWYGFGYSNKELSKEVLFWEMD